jgi:type IV pilus assembly protein PilV
VLNPKHLPGTERGSFIIEAIISLLLFAVGLISLLALSVQALNQVSQSKARNDASYIAGELIAEMWVGASVNLSNWNDRLQTVVPGATGTVYLSTCDCVETSGANACSGAASGTVNIANPQPVTVCISWTDRKDPDAPRRYQASSMISRNT